MNIWFYTFLIMTVLSICLIIKLLVMKSSIREIERQFTRILESDTNSLITLSSLDRDLKNLVANIDFNLRKLRKLELVYKQGNSELSSSITNISHDLRTPLTAIRGYLDLLETKNLSDKQKNYLKIIDTKVRELTTLTEQLFDFTRTIDTSKQNHKEDVCLNAILEEAIGSSYDLFMAKGITPKVTLTQKKIVKNIDKTALTRILENLLSNAIKYCDDYISITLTEDGSMIFVNNSKLFDKTMVEKMFDRYYTVENGKKSAGIGLSIAKQLVELNGGIMISDYKNDLLTISIKF